MNKNVTIAVLGIALLVSILFLITRSRLPVEPPPGPVPTPAPTPQPEKTCEFRTIEFKWEKSQETGKVAVFAHPEHLDDVQDCAEVIFVNLTDQNFTIVFDVDNDETAEDSPFSGIDKITLEAHGEDNQFSKSFSVDIELPNDDVFYDFPYKVDPEAPPETEQSPRIRVGPKKVNR